MWTSAEAPSILEMTQCIWLVVCIIRPIKRKREKRRKNSLDEKLNIIYFHRSSVVHCWIPRSRRTVKERVRNAFTNAFRTSRSERVRVLRTRSLTVPSAFVIIANAHSDWCGTYTNQFLLLIQPFFLVFNDFSFYFFRKIKLQCS
jgi:hypothetical protein